MKADVSTSDLLAVVRDRIVERFDPVRVIVFGSRARGEAGPDSDLDLLVVLAKVDNKRHKAIEIRRVLRDLPVEKDIVVTTPEELARRGQIVGTVLRSAMREGQVILKRNSCVTQSHMPRPNAESGWDGLATDW